MGLEPGKNKRIFAWETALFQYLPKSGQEEMGFYGTKRELSHSEEGLSYSFHVQKKSTLFSLLSACSTFSLRSSVSIFVNKRKWRVKGVE